MAVCCDELGESLPEGLPYEIGTDLIIGVEADARR